MVVFVTQLISIFIRPNNDPKLSVIIIHGLAITVSCICLVYVLSCSNNYLNSTLFNPMLALQNHRLETFLIVFEISLCPIIYTNYDLHYY